MIDFHCHLDLYPDPAAVVADAVRNGVYVLGVTTTPAAWDGVRQLVADARRVRLAVGIHPELAHTRHADVDRLSAVLAETRYVGEVGLDGSPSLQEHAAMQKDVFGRILRACRDAGGKILSIHSRRAANEVLDCLAHHGDAGTPVLHWFSGTPAQLRRAVEMGCWFSVGPAMVTSGTGREFVRLIPRHRLLTESDGPFVKVASRPATPLDMELVEAVLSELWGESSADAVRASLQSNLRSLVSSS
ncbi:MAG: TatD family hydrolase [Phycisphaerales bacterium]|nr:TatD family hydrolase [Phycisphaerales bacterium]